MFEAYIYWYRGNDYSAKQTEHLKADDEQTLQMKVKKFAEAKAEQGFTSDIYYFPKPKKAAK